LRYFKRLKSVEKSTEEQGYIYYCCRTYSRREKRVQQKIDRLCDLAAGEYAAALREFLLTDADWIYICQKHHISESTLDRIRRRFYELW